MATETQKNFKKQMKQLEQNMSNKKQDQFYSYSQQPSTYANAKRLGLATHLEVIAGSSLFITVATL